jgi:hypothetical protein
VLELMASVPPGVVGVRATEEVTAEDYEQVLVPAIYRVLADHDKVRLLYELEEDVGYEAGAIWQDARLGLTHFASFERVAVVTDAEWLRKAAPVFSVLMPGQVRAFSLAERDAATAWVAEDMG